MAVCGWQLAVAGVEGRAAWRLVRGVAAQVQAAATAAGGPAAVDASESALAPIRRCNCPDTETPFGGLGPAERTHQVLVSPIGIVKDPRACELLDPR